MQQRIEPTHAGDVKQKRDDQRQPGIDRGKGQHEARGAWHDAVAHTDRLESENLHAANIELRQNHHRHR